MSTWLVSPHHIDLLVSAAIDYRISARFTNEGGTELVTEANGQACGRLLWSENIRSLCYRYNLAGTEEERGYLDALAGYQFRRHAGIRASAVAAALACYDYQACECPDYRQTAASLFVGQLQQAVGKKPQGYDAEPWGFDSAEQVHAAQGGAA